VELQAAAPTHARFGVLLRAARIEAGLTQADLAERAGLSPRRIQHLESGLGHPFAHSAQRLAEALNLTSAARTEFLATARRAPKRACVARAAFERRYCRGREVSLLCQRSLTETNAQAELPQLLAERGLALVHGHGASPAAHASPATGSEAIAIISHG
jgi:transcriptional regulator with XRE-family HTH domain